MFNSVNSVIILKTAAEILKTAALLTLTHTHPFIQIVNIRVNSVFLFDLQIFNADSGKLRELASDTYENVYFIFFRKCIHSKFHAVIKGFASLGNFFG